MGEVVWIIFNNVFDVVLVNINVLPVFFSQTLPRFLDHIVNLFKNGYHLYVKCTSYLHFVCQEPLIILFCIVFKSRKTKYINLKFHFKAFCYGFRYKHTNTDCKIVIVTRTTWPSKLWSNQKFLMGILLNWHLPKNLCMKLATHVFHCLCLPC